MRRENRKNNKMDSSTLFPILELASAVFPKVLLSSELDKNCESKTPDEFELNLLE